MAKTTFVESLRSIDRSLNAATPSPVDIFVVHFNKKVPADGGKRLKIDLIDDHSEIEEAPDLKGDELKARRQVEEAAKQLKHALGENSAQLYQVGDIPIAMMDDPTDRNEYSMNLRLCSRIGVSIRDACGVRGVPITGMLKEIIEATEKASAAEAENGYVNETGQGLVESVNRYPETASIVVDAGSHEMAQNLTQVPYSFFSQLSDGKIFGATDVSVKDDKTGKIELHARGEFPSNSLRSRLQKLASGMSAWTKDDNGDYVSGDIGEANRADQALSFVLGNVRRKMGDESGTFIFSYPYERNKQRINTRGFAGPVEENDDYVLSKFIQEGIGGSIQRGPRLT